MEDFDLCFIRTDNYQATCGIVDFDALGKFKFSINQDSSSINGFCKYTIANSKLIKYISFTDFSISLGDSPINQCILKLVYFNFTFLSIDCIGLTHLIRNTDYFIDVVQINLFIVFDKKQRFILDFEVFEYFDANPPNKTAVVSAIISSILSIILTIAITFTIYMLRLRCIKINTNKSTFQTVNVDHKLNPVFILKPNEIKKSIKVKSPQHRVTSNMLLMTESGEELNSKEHELLTIKAGERDISKKRVETCHDIEDEPMPPEIQNESINLCILCDKIMKSKDTIMSLLCEHKFHYACINNYIDFKGAVEVPCPICSKPIKKEKKDRIEDPEANTKAKNEKSSKKLPSFLLMLKKRTRKLGDSKAIINLFDMKFGTANISKKKESMERETTPIKH